MGQAQAKTSGGTIMPGIGIGISPHFQNKKFSFSQYWATLISATVENAAPTHVVLTFPEAKTALGASDFTIAGFTVSSASWAGAVLTLVLSEAVLIFDGNLTITFVKTGTTATVTNNVADDGNTVARFDSRTGMAISQWNDISGNARHLTQATADKQPSLSDDGLLFDGTDDYMETSLYALNQPLTIYLSIKQLSYTPGDNILCSHHIGFKIYQSASIANGIGVYANGAAGINAAAALNEDIIVRVVFNGANSILQVDDNDAVNGTATAPGALGLNGIILAKEYNSETKYGNILYHDVIIRSGADSVETRDAIYNSLKKK